MRSIGANELHSNAPQCVRLSSFCTGCVREAPPRPLASCVAVSVVPADLAARAPRDVSVVLATRGRFAETLSTVRDLLARVDVNLELVLADQNAAWPNARFEAATRVRELWRRSTR